MHFQLNSTLSRIGSRISPTIFLIIWFILTRIIFYLLGIRFDDRSLTDFWQVADIELLKTNLLETLFYLHSQPPLYNLFLGIFLKCLGNQAAIGFHVSHLIFGLLLTISLSHLLARFGISTRLNIVIVGIFIITPPVILYENWLFYTYPLTLILTLSLLFLFRFVESQRFKDGLIFFTLLAMVCLIRSLFHLAWFLAILILLILMRPQLRRMALRTAFIPFLIIFALYAKNLTIFGSFTSSTWLGMGLSQMTTSQLPDTLRDRLITESKLSSFARYPGFPKPENLDGLNTESACGFPILDNLYKSTGGPNFNHKIYLEISHNDFQDFRYLVLHYPSYYFESVGKALHYYFQPSADYLFLKSNREHYPLYDAAYKTLVCGNFGKFIYPEEPSRKLTQIQLLISRAHIFLIMWIFILVGYGVIEVIRRRQSQEFTPQQIALLFMLANIFYVALIGNLFECGENNRFRFTTSPMFAILAAIAIRQVIHFARSQMRTRERVPIEKC